MDDSKVLSKIGAAIRSLRQATGYSQERLAEESGLDRSFLGKIERGEVNVSVLTLCEISRGLNITFSTLIAIAHENK